MKLNKKNLDNNTKKNKQDNKSKSKKFTRKSRRRKQRNDKVLNNLRKRTEMNIEKLLANNNENLY